MSRNDKTRTWFRAIQSGDLSEVERLLPECAGICGDFGETGLQYAVQMKNAEIVRLLIDYEVGMVNNEGCTALIMAALNNSADLCSILAPLEADIILPDKRDAYMIAAQVGSYDALVELRHYFSLVTDDHDLNALDYASMTGNLRCVVEIVTQYKPSKQECIYSRTLAETEGHHAVVRYFDTGDVDPQACESDKVTDAPALITDFTMQSLMLPAQGVQSPRTALNNLNYSTITVERQKSVPDSASDAEFDETIHAIAKLVDKVPTLSADLITQIPEQSPTRKKANKDKGFIKALKADKKQKQKHADDSKFVRAKPHELQGQSDHHEVNPLLIERNRDEIPEGFLSIQSQVASKDSFPYELLKTNQRSKSGMCGSRVGRKGGLTQSSNAILPLLERKDTEIRYLQSQLEALTLRRSTLMTDSFAMIDACTSCCSKNTCFFKLASDNLLTSKNEFIDRLINLCISLSPDSSNKRIDTCVETDLIDTMALPEVSTQRVFQSKGSHEMLEECSYESLLRAKDLEIDRLQKLVFETDIRPQSQSKREAKLCKELDAKILKEVELIGLIDEVTQEIKALKDKIVMHKKVLTDIQHQGFISDRRTERDIRLEDLFDQTLRSCDVIREIKQQMIAFKAEFSGYTAQTELLARTLFNESGTNDLNKSLKRSSSCSRINPMSGTGRLPVPNPPNPPLSVTLHPPTRSSSLATLQPLKPPIKPIDYSGLLQAKDSCIERLVTLLYISPNTLYPQFVPYYPHLYILQSPRRQPGTRRL
ncbi:Protein 21.1 [Giardia lamblia P15]|uniref:Protein 21.1 n=1 Tax=Giardia intestinalis (strain P15) TaxID=658858 RepID=E1F5F3_GIAIA|nr:Protein 21.1 [Giardia lamblia P15]